MTASIGRPTIPDSASRSSPKASPRTVIRAAPTGARRSGADRDHDDRVTGHFGREAALRRGQVGASPQITDLGLLVRPKTKLLPIDRDLPRLCRAIQENNCAA